MPVRQCFSLALVLVIAWSAFIVLGLTNGYHGYYVAIAAGLGVAVYPLARGPVSRNDAVLADRFAAGVGSLHKPNAERARVATARECHPAGRATARCASRR
jgi:hypothetical protein